MLIANLLLMEMKRQLKRSWIFSSLATLMRIVIIYYVDFCSLFEHSRAIGRRSSNPKKPFNQIFLVEGLTKTKTDGMKPIYLDPKAYSIDSLILADYKNPL